MQCIFDADKVFAHRWPHDTPEWEPDFKKLVADCINTTGSSLRRIVLSANSVSVGGHTFESLKNVGASVPFFKQECRMMFEGVCMGMHAHVHLYSRSSDSYLESFESVTHWMRECGHLGHT